MQPPPLLEDLPPARRFVNRFVSPAVFGIVAGLVLGASEPIYWALQVLAALGGLVAGFEHRSAREGAARGVVGGLLFGAFLLIAHWISGAEAEADIGDPEALLVVVTTVAGAALGAAGGAARARVEARRAARVATRSAALTTYRLKRDMASIPPSNQRPYERLVTIGRDHGCERSARRQAGRRPAARRPQRRRP